MCGIAGWLGRSRDGSAREAVIWAMTKTLTQRGPDSQDVWLDDEIALGHSRLSVIDPAGGRQPMIRLGPGGEPVVLVFNGEIYNYVELREQLRTFGWSFTTGSDTEVLLVAYLHWGAEFTGRLNGMYGFAIWDARVRELILVRDRFGIKPLYYAQIGEHLLFGSEPKALLTHPDYVAEVDREGLAELMAVPRARTPGHGTFRGLREVKPGHVLTASRSGVRERQYWRLTADEHVGDFATSTRHVHDLLQDVVAHEVVADVPVGSLLSGGIDSSAVTAMAAHHLGGNLTSYSVNPPSDRTATDDVWRTSADGPYAELVAEKLGITHVVTDVSVDSLIASYDVGLRARDLPGWGDLDGTMHQLFQSVRQNCVVALSGEAADEMFGGYLWQRDPAFVAHPSFPWMYGRRQPEFLLRDEVRKLIEPERYEADRYHQALQEVPRLAGEDAVRRRQRQVFHLGVTRWLTALLDRQDRMSMAVGLEVRVPFADHRLAQYLFNVPDEIKAPGGVAKALLRQAAVGLLPAQIIDRAKSAYPASRNSEYVRRMRELVLQLLSDPAAPVFDVLDREKVRRAVESDGLGGLPGPITAGTPAIGLSYLLELNQWFTAYGVRLVL